MLYHVLNKTIRVAVCNYDRQDKHNSEIKNWLIDNHIRKVPYVRTALFFKRKVTKINFCRLHAVDVWESSNSVINRKFIRHMAAINKNYPTIYESFKHGSKTLHDQMSMCNESSIGYCILDASEVAFVKTWAYIPNVFTLNTLMGLKIAV
jgi:hypothetical protein